MMGYKNISVWVLICFISSIQLAFCQPSESQMKDLEIQARKMLANFTSNIEKIGEKNASNFVKDYLVDWVPDNLFKEGAIIEVSSTNSELVKRYSIKEYLIRLKNLTYDNISISFVAEALYFDLNTFHKLPNEEKYVGSSAVVQCFCGTYNDTEMSKFNYCDDCTKKVIEVIIEKQRDWEGEHWRVLLGDVIVKETDKS